MGSAGTVKLSYSTTSTTDSSVTVKVTMKYVGNGETYNYSPSSNNCKITLNGTTKYFTASYTTSTSTQTMGSASFTISRASTTKSYTATGTILNYSRVYSDPSGTCSVSVAALDDPKVIIYFRTYYGEIKNSPYKYTTSGGDTYWFKIQQYNGVDFVYTSSTKTGTYTRFAQSVKKSETYKNLFDVSTFGVTRTGYHIVDSEAYHAASTYGGTSVLFSQADSSSNTTNKVTTKRLNNGTQITSDVSRTIFMNWIPNTYTVAYNKNGGSGTTMSSSTYTYGTAKALKANTYTPPAGHKFGGWATSSSGSAVYADKESVKNLTTTNNGTVTLYAVWVPYTMTIKYNVNGGTITDSPHHYNPSSGQDYYFRISNSLVQRSTSSTASTFKDYTSKITADTNHYNPYDVATFNITKTGYKVNSSEAYNTKANGTGVSLSQADTSSNTTNPWTTKRINGGTEISANTTKTIYINWKPLTVTVTLNKNSGTGGTSSVTGTYDQLLPNITKPTRTNYEFLGYYTATSGGTQYIDHEGHGSRVWNKTANTTLYAQWSNSQWSVSLHAVTRTSSGSVISTAGGTVSGGGKVNRGSSCTVKATAKTGYTFKGWASSTTATTYVSTSTSYTFTPSASTTLYAIFQANIYAIVASSARYVNGITTASTVGGTVSGGGNYDYGTEVTLTHSEPNTGYHWKGWYSSTNLSAANLLSQDDEYEFICTTARTIYGVFESNKYTIRLYPNGGNGTTVLETHEYSVAKSIQTVNFTWPGRSIVGWNSDQDDANDGITEFAVGDSIPATYCSTQDDIITFYAVWNKWNTVWGNQVNTWNKMNGLWVKPNKDWKPIVSIWIYSGGTWKAVFGAGIPSSGGSTPTGCQHASAQTVKLSYCIGEHDWDCCTNEGEYQNFAICPNCGYVYVYATDDPDESMSCGICDELSDWNGYRDVWLPPNTFNGLTELTEYTNIVRPK